MDPAVVDATASPADPGDLGMSALMVFEDPLVRLDARMPQTPQWAQLRQILDEQPAWVRNSICPALDQGFSRAFQNYARQIQFLNAFRTELQSVMESEDANQLCQLMRDIYPSKVHALQREADGIDESIKALRTAAEAGNIEGLQQQ
ncbi:C3H1-type domain-containing protein, partial [Durusdinium trenchii]